MGLTTDMLKKIKEEIGKDPMDLGYAGKTDGEIATLLSSNIYRLVSSTDIIVSPINRILAGLAESPNVVSAIEVTQAKLTT